MLNKQEIKKNFSQSAVNYEKHAVLQKKMAGQLLASIGRAKWKKILDLGCGTGYLAYRLAKKYPQAKVTGIDLAPGMIKVAQKRYRRNNLHFQVGDGEKFSGRNYDLIVSNASLQWMEINKVVRRIEKRLLPGGWFVFKTFGPKTLQELRCSGFRVNKFVSLSAIRRALDKQFEIISCRSITTKQSFRNAREALYHLKELGAQSTAGPKNKEVLGAFRNLRQRHQTKKGVPVTFEVIAVAASQLPGLPRCSK